MTEKLEISNTELNAQKQYKNILEKALQSAILLNKIIRGKSVEEYSDEELSEAILIQSNVVTKEEIIEWISNYGLCLPSPYKIIDTLAIAKKMFKLPFKNLKYLAEFLGVTQKIETGGAKFWKLAAIGYSEDVMHEVLEYNKGDIYTLRDVYLKLRGFSNDGVNLGAFNGGDELSCPSCSSNDLSKLNKQATTTRHQYDVYRCNHCQALSRSANVKGEAKYLVHVSG